MSGKLIIISAPSGCGKSTIISHLMERGNIQMEFSVSATNRQPRPGETDGVNYHFLTTENFNDLISKGEFIEYEEVYPGRFYGTLKSEIQHRLDSDRNIILDVDVKGGINVKHLYGDRALSIFIEPPSIEILRSRLTNRGTEAPEVVEERVARAEFEISMAQQFDAIVVNNDLDEAVGNTERIITEFLTR